MRGGLGRSARQCAARGRRAARPAVVPPAQQSPADACVASSRRRPSDAVRRTLFRANSHARDLSPRAHHETE
ncbi:unnamed protein product [Pieris macdunnoughi]|uniref:Uncharacterized protein n=1 Tax=Pieris macdunnoughi TaxID=345717 RepID=A0A821Q8U5_9NEOP|nr:unnamed protein product [Pieris macdunnoughi]